MSAVAQPQATPAPSRAAGAGRAARHRDLASGLRAAILVPAGAHEGQRSRCGGRRHVADVTTMLGSPLPGQDAREVTIARQAGARSALAVLAADRATR
ncbi:hypothetical protein HBB16_19995 [Pseudonocardia sp. MCCB 268]|nr:hypothetical protein [Pseudonocardia cytotoxica]